MVTMTDCGAAKLMGAILGVNPDNIKRILGMSYHSCLYCGQPIPTKNQKYCNMKCKYEFTHIQVVCTCGCGRMCIRYQSEIVFRANHPQPGNRKPQERTFYSKQCVGRWLGKNYGWGRSRP